MLDVILLRGMGICGSQEAMLPIIVVAQLRIHTMDRHGQIQVQDLIFSVLAVTRSPGTVLYGSPAATYVPIMRYTHMIESTGRYILRSPLTLSY